MYFNCSIIGHIAKKCTAMEMGQEDAQNFQYGIWLNAKFSRTTILQTIEMPCDSMRKMMEFENKGQESECQIGVNSHKETSFRSENAEKRMIVVASFEPGNDFQRTSEKAANSSGRICSHAGETRILKH